MKTAEPRPIHLRDYAPPPYCIPNIVLDFGLDGQGTRVKATMNVERRAIGPEPLVLDGNGLKLVSVAIDGKTLEASAYVADSDMLTMFAPPGRFTLEVVTETAPAANTAL